MIPAALRERLQAARSLTVQVKVIPKASKNEVAGLLEDGSLKVKVTAAPEKGKANAAVCDLLAEAFGVSRRNVEIVRGDTSQTKRVLIRM